MDYNDHFYKAFLEQMQDLENFRMSYSAMHPSAPLDSDDPDVKRLIEAMAFFSARTHMAGMKNITASRRRLFRQFFPYLLSPLPTMGILQIQPTGRFVESVFLPKNTEIAISAESQAPAIFRTLCDLNVLPMSLTHIHTEPLPNKGHRVSLHLKTPFPLTEKIERLRFHINHLNDYHASMRVFVSLQKYLKSITVVFNDNAAGRARGKPCRTSFGIPYAHTDIAIQHPLQQERLFFHFPQQELFMEVDIPEGPRQWHQVTLMLDLDAGWPGNLHLNREVFQLFSIPIMNLQQAMAQPFVCDGTRERYPIRHMEPDKEFELHSVLGVYTNEQSGMLPVTAGILTGDQGSYEIDQSTTKEGKHHFWANLNLPDAFENHRTIMIDALWLQPWFSAARHKRLDIAPYHKSAVGLKWGLSGDLVPHAENTFQDETEGFVHLLTLKNRSILNLDEVLSILRVLGSVHQGKFKQVMDLLTDIRVAEKPLQKGTAPGMQKLVYRLKFAGLNPAVMPLIETFARHVGRILDTWISDAKVGVKVEFAKQYTSMTAE